MIARHHRTEFSELFSAIAGRLSGAVLGIGYDVLLYNLLSRPATNYPRTNTQTDTPTTLVDAFPTLLPTTNVVTFRNTATFGIFPRYANPTTNYWSLSLQRQRAQTSSWIYAIVRWASVWRDLHAEFQTSAGQRGSSRRQHCHRWRHPARRCSPEFLDPKLRGTS